VNDDKLIRLYTQTDLTLDQIAAEMGWANKKIVNKAIWRLRQRGVEIPPRQEQVHHVGFQRFFGRWQCAEIGCMTTVYFKDGYRRDEPAWCADHREGHDYQHPE
jgi:biotin operon repressor